MSAGPLEAAPCSENIGPRERQKRLTFGAILGMGGLALSVYAAGQASVNLALLAFLPYLAAGICLFEARDHTCVLLAATGQRNMDDGFERLTLAADRQAMWRKALRVYAKAGALAAAVTLSGAAFTLTR